MTGVHFDDADDGAQLVAALTEQGYATSWSRDGFAGEDDSDDRAWLLHVEPFDAGVVALVDVHGGWLPGAPHDAAPSPVALPTGPKRLKRD